MSARNLAWIPAGAAALILVGVAVAGFQPRDPQCFRSEPARPLKLEMAADRAHLQADRDDIGAIASAFATEVARRPMLSDSIDAQTGALTAPIRARAWCEAVLEDQLATTHALPLTVVEGGPSHHDRAGDAHHADTERASGNAPASSVVSRPSR
jgi:hypothetical protein